MAAQTLLRQAACKSREKSIQQAIALLQIYCKCCFPPLPGIRVPNARAQQFLGIPCLPCVTTIAHRSWASSLHALINLRKSQTSPFCNTLVKAWLKGDVQLQEGDKHKINITSDNIKPHQTAVSLHLRGDYVGRGSTQLKLSRAIKRKGNFTTETEAFYSMQEARHSSVVPKPMKCK